MRDVITQQDFYAIYILKQLQIQCESVKSMFSHLTNDFPNKPLSQNYFYETVHFLKGKKAIAEACIEGKTTFYQITPEGETLFQQYLKHYKPPMLVLKEIADRFVHEITGTGNPKPAEFLTKDRTFFSSLVSVKNIIRYIILKEAIHHSTIVISDIITLLETEFGWRASKSWIYEITHEMEENEEGGPLLIGSWIGERRTKRYYSITERGKEVFNQIANDARSDALKAQHFINDLLVLFFNK